MSLSDKNTLSDFSDLVELLLYRAKNQADKKAFIFLEDGEVEGPCLTYESLDRKARAIGAMLQTCTQKGDRVLLLYQPGLEFITAFFGCLYAGVMAVPAYPPKVNRPMPRLQSIISDSSAAAVLTVESIYSGMEKRFDTAPDLKTMKWFVTDEIQEELGNKWKNPEINSDTIAFLQYTSGSTGAPKGVMVSHGNLIHNQRMIKKAYNHTENTIYVSWLPLFHDMGLIGNVLQTVYLGTTCVIMAPAAFLQKPYRWLKAVSHYKANTSGGPNFCYDLCVKTITPEQIETLDFSNWNVVYSGAEPVRSSTLEAFAKMFEKCGLRREAFYPCYGLAEATLFVTGLLRNSPPVVAGIDPSALAENRIVEIPDENEDVQRFVSCGHAWMDQEVVIAEPENLTECPENQVGEILISGGSVAKGYWNKKEETNHTFNAHLQDGRGPYLRTGDLGFLRQGELFVTGRLKDLIIIRGRNHYPQDIEFTVEECHEALRQSGGAAFSADVENEERLVIVHEVERQYRNKNLDDVLAAIRRNVAEKHELQVYSIALIMPGSILKTSSGKIQRRACKAAFLAGELNTVCTWQADMSPVSRTDSSEQEENADDTKSVLLQMISSIVGIPSESIDENQPVANYGPDSLQLVELMHNIEMKYGVKLAFSAFFDNTLAEIVRLIDKPDDTVGGTAGANADNGDHKAVDGPLSRGQKALWFMQQMQPENTVYNITRTVWIESGLDIQILKRSFERLIERHPVLRTTFHNIDGEPVQRVNSELENFFAAEDASGWEENRLTEVVHTESQKPFDLEKGPLFKVFIYSVSDNKHLMLISLHHIITDFWSLSIIMNEISLLYSEEKNGIKAELKPIKSDYNEYIARQEKILEGPEGKKLWEYWSKQLASDLPVLSMPADRPRPLVQTFNGSSISFKIGSRTTDLLKDIARNNGATLYMVLLAAYEILLHRYTGQREVLVGSPTAGRDNAVFSDVAGYFVNPIVIKSKYSDELKFSDFLATVRKTVLEAFSNQQYPFATLVEKLQPQREPGYSPVFQAMFAMQKAHMLNDKGLTPFALEIPGAEMQLGELLFRSADMSQKTAQFELTATFAETEDGLAAILEYNTDLFDESTIKRLAENLEVLIDDITKNKDVEISGLQLITKAEREKVLTEWNSTGALYPENSCIHYLFEEQVKKTPDKTAVIFENEKLSYHELNARANRVAHFLTKQGVKPGTLVGLCLNRSLNMIVGLLGILKAGGTYIPLDPSYPADRLSYMLQDSKLSLLLTGTHLYGFAEGIPVKIVNMDTLDEKISGDNMENPEIEISSANLAYIIYTSGSTGKPKGVQISHKALINFIVSMQREPGLSEADRLLSVTTLSFDIAGLEMYLPLVAGACLIIAGRETVYDADALMGEIDRHDISVMQATPATWKMLIDAGWKGKKDLKLLCGGEAMSRELADQLLQRCGCLWNMYGPTETTIWSTIKNVKSGDPQISIGRPINNTQIYILDSNMEPVPVGVTGEIFIGGDGLSSGYLNRPELTAERFVGNPFGSGPDSRIYRTGDLGRYLPDGNIEALGRIDNQVKIRGFRIELEEIEALLSKHPAIHEAVVAAKVVSSGDRQLIAYFTCEGYDVPADLELRNHLKHDLPVYMIPSAFVRVPSIPLTPNGKVDRLSLPIPESLSKQTEKKYTAPQNELEGMIAEIWSQVLQIQNVGTEDNFFDLGGHSLLLSKVHNTLKKKVQKDITMVDMFKYPTVQALAGFLSSGGDSGKNNSKRSSKFKNNSDIKNRDIAIVGMSGRFPGAKNVDEFWDNLQNGVESVKFFTDEELKAAGVDDALLNNADYVKARAVVDNAEYFDASFFGFSPREAEILDPQHRLFLECAWEALEYSGYDPDRFDGRIGVFAGVGLNHYLLNMYSENGLIDSLGTYQTFIGNDKDFVPTRVSYKLNLKGPSVNVQTACSSSLVAIHLARQSLYTGECDMVLAGGVSVKTPQSEGYLYQKGGIPSPDGHCRAFDAKAQGTVFGNGIGIVVLKRLEDAIADGDSIHAVIKGTAINNDGSSKIGYTAPSVEGQTAVICEALENAGLPPETITYIEAHGTGTPLGDPIEISALKEVFKNIKEKEYTKIGSVKTNIGHLDTAAGAAGIIKTVLALKHRQLPPSLHFETPNPELGLEDSPFCINHRLSDWEPGEAGSPLRAGVSSFGIGGTNAHIILEEAPAKVKSGQSRPWKLLEISARTQTALDEVSQNLMNYFKQNPDTELADAAYTLQTGRKPMSCRRIVVCRDSDDAAAALEALEPQRVFSGSTKTKKPVITFMFPGQGSQYINMAHDLYQNEPVFKETVDKCCIILKPVMGFDLRELIYPEDLDVPAQSEKLRQTQITQPVLFVIEYAAAKLLESMGIQPTSMIGHSIGEYTAACISGVFSLEDALTLVAARGRLMQSCEAGSMLAVSLSEDKVIPYLAENVSVAAVNSPNLCVVSGPNEAIEALEQKLTGNGIVCTHLHTSHAFHSYMMNPILEDFRKTVERVKMNPPGIRFMSNITGDWISEGDATDPDYWVRHLRSAVRFADGIKKLVEEPDCILLEVGPGQALCTLARQQAGQDKVLAILSSIRHPKESTDDSVYFLNTVGRLWLAGAEADWTKYYANEERYRIPLPTYPFERQRYFIEVNKKKPDNSRKTLAKVSDMSDWFYMPTWKKTMPPAGKMETTGGKWLVFSEAEGSDDHVANLLKAENIQVVSVVKGEGFNRISDLQYAINSGKKDDYFSLIEDLKKEDRFPDTIVHLWSYNCKGLPVDGHSPENDLAMGFYSLMYIAQAIGKYHLGNALRIEVVTNNMQKVESRDVIFPGKAALAGPLKVIPQEYPGISCRCIDLGTEDVLDEDMAEQLVAELMSSSDKQMIAYRGTDRWVQEYEAVRINEGMGIPDSLRENGVYLITGGTGGMALEIAGYLAQKVKAKIILVGRSEFPKKENWEQWLSEHEENNEISIKIKKIQEIEKLGGKVSVMTGDTARIEDMKACADFAVQTYGGLNGVIHAAGVPGGGIIQLKTPETAAKVFMPKVQGVLALSLALEGIDLDLFILCSSINSIMGGFGQMDYTAANAYLDAFAQSRASRKGTRYISINWDRWKDVGMAVRSTGTASSGQGGALSTTPIVHPLLDQCVVETLNKDVYSTVFQVKKHWVLSEHTIAGRPTIPGTTYLEMVRAAFEKHADGKNIEISETAFMAPLVVEGDETRETLTLLNEKDDFYEFKVMSRLVSEEGKTLPWQVHAAGKIRSCEVQPEAQFDINSIITKCNKKEIEVRREDMGAEKLSFVGTGPRWNNLKKVYIGEDEALTVLELSEEFLGDLELMKLHPAVMDVATGFVQRFVGDGNYLPLAYEKLSVKAGMAVRMYGYARFKDKGLLNQKDTITCDIYIMDENGKELIDITGFTMKRVNKEAAASLNSLYTKGEYEELETEGLAAAADPMFGKLSGKAQWSRDDGLSVQDAMGVFDRILSGCTVPQIIVSARQLDAVIESINSFNREKIADEMDSEKFSQPVHARPTVNSIFIAPGNELEQTIGSIWQKVLGIDRIGVNDNFFELGGSSLTGIQVVAELKKALGVELPTVSIFEAPTVSLMAKLLSPEKNQQSFDHTRNRAEKKREALNRKRIEAKEKRR
jgi:amino acid adenylation domain-containing protein